MKEEIIKNAMNAFSIESESLLKTAEVIDKNEFARAVEILAKAPKIASSGCGHSGIACRHFAHLMCCIERPARFISPAEAVHGALGFLAAGDVILLVSRGGKTDELMPIADICRKKGVTVITVTENTSSPLAEKADIILAMAVTKECDKYNFDALQSAVLEYTEFKNEEFAVIHPAGAVGKRLNNK